MLVKDQFVDNPAVSHVGVSVDPTRNNSRGDGTFHFLSPSLQSLAPMWRWIGKQPKAVLDCTEIGLWHFVCVLQTEGKSLEDIRTQQRCAMSTCALFGQNRQVNFLFF